MLLLLIVLALVAIVAYRHYLHQQSLPITGKAILITGCDSGFGRLIAQDLDRRGLRVFAGCYSKDGIASLTKECSSQLLAFELDVTKEASIEAAYQTVQSNLNGDCLWGVINNAGISKGWVTEFSSMNEYRLVMEVNYFGMVAVSKRFLTLIQQSHGRIINITSLAGRYASPGMGAYSASKHAAEAFSDALRGELRHWGCKVVAVEPGFMNTNILNGMDELKAEWTKIPKELREKYGEEYFQHSTAQMERVRQVAENPKAILPVISHGLFSKHPYYRYFAGKMAIVFGTMINILPSEVFDMISRLVAPPPTIRSARTS